MSKPPEHANETASEALLKGVDKNKAKSPLESAGELSSDELDKVTGGTTQGAPRDIASGLPAGKRMHKPFTLT